ncbi:curli-like amyloid fiber formation chaperone CsgH [Gymnodinialimonas hymeniacidonis]|uniref:curli-like amyloid fiber formation chaperone CsgH n=1 Tax=Gymnodinialimonas hymeniacidonis TaxID=3126508 RepID=UPI0034C6A3F6
MTKFSKSRAALGLAAISSAVLGCTAISAEPADLTREAHAQAAAPIACVITAEAQGSMLTLAPVVQASEAVSGIYSLRVEGPGTRLNQGGPFSARAGETVTLGRMMTSGSASSLDAELTLTIDGREYRCPADL